MLFDVTASETTPLSLSEQDVAALAACGRGTILFDVAARADATLIALTGTNGRITLSLRAGRLDGEQGLGLMLLQLADGKAAVAHGRRVAADIGLVDMWFFRRHHQ